MSNIYKGLGYLIILLLSTFLAVIYAIIDIDNIQLKKNVNIKILHIISGFYIIFVLTFLQQIYSFKFLKNDPIFKKEIIEFNQIDIFKYFKEILLDSILINAVFNFYIKEFFIYFGVQNHKIFLSIIFVLFNSFLCQYKIKKYLILNLVYFTILCFLIFNDSIIISFFNYFFANLSNFILRKLLLV